MSMACRLHGILLFLLSVCTALSADPPDPDDLVFVHLRVFPADASLRIDGALSYPKETGRNTPTYEISGGRHSMVLTRPDMYRKR